MQAIKFTPDGKIEAGSLLTGAPEADRVAAWFNGVLNDSFVMIRDARLPASGTSIDLLVVGPPGIWALYVETDPGQYRAAGADFFAWNSATGGYVQVDPNPLEHLLFNQAQLRGWLNAAGLPPDCVKSAIFFTDSATRVDNVNAEVQLVKAEDIEGFPVEIVRQPALLDANAVQQAVKAITTGELPSAPPPSPGAQPAATASGRLPLLGLQRRQLILLGVLAALDVILLAGACLMVTWPLIAGQ